MQNSVAKKFYRFGVLEGNHVEERFGLDYIDRSNPPMSSRTEQRDRYNLQSTLYNKSNYSLIDKNNYPQRALSARVQEPEKNQSTLTKEYYDTKEKISLIEDNPNLKINNELQKSLALNMRGEPAHILFGHSLNQDNFKRREFFSAYDLTMNKKLPPQTYLKSKFDVNTMTITTNPAVTSTTTNFKIDSAMNINNNSNSHHRLIPVIGDKTILNTQQKSFRSYDEYTKAFDSTHKKIGLRR